MKHATEFARLSGNYFTRGKLVPSTSAERKLVIDPATATEIGYIASVTPDEIDDVVAAARTAQGEWWATESALHRAELLHDVARRLRTLKPSLAELLTRETGKPFKESADEIDWSISAIDYYAELGRHSMGSVLGPAVAGQLHYTLKEPMGTVVIILPANYPLLLLTWEAAAALAAGNAVVVKPSEWASLTTLKFMEIFDQLPDGLVQCVTGGGEVGAQLVEHSDTHMVGFTGSVATGRRIAQSCADRFKPFLIEASGNDAFIVMPSAPVDVAARAAAFAAFFNCGQVCTSAERLFVHEVVYDQFVDLLVAEAGKLRIGNGLDQVDIGPMENIGERDRFERVVARAIEQGATLKCGGGRPDGLSADLADGFFVEPTVITDVTLDMDVLNSEIFGPLAPIVKVSSLAEAIEATNRSDFGLGATVYTTDAREVYQATNAIVAGMVWVNAPILDNDAGPFGGRKMSGVGRQLGGEGLDTFRHTKLVMVDPYATEHDFWWFPYSAEEAWPGTAV